jgi:hypothetical protein
VILNELRVVLKEGRQTNNGADGFTEVGRRKRHANQETTHTSKKATPPGTTADAS